MQKPSILVTGATGKTGTPTALMLLQKGYAVRALVHKKDARSAALQTAGADIIAGSLEDPVDVRGAMKGVQRAYFCPPLEPGSLRRAAIFAEAAEEARLEAIVALSQWLVDRTHLSIHAREKYLAERMFRWAASVGVITINPVWFADNYMAALEPISQFGLMALPLGSGLNAPPSNSDIAKVIVGTLVDPAPCIGKTFRPTGPKLLSPEEIAFTFGKVLGRKVRYQDAPMSLFLKFGKSIGLSDFVLTQLYFFLLDYQRGSFGVGAPTDTVRIVGGAEPQDFETIVRHYVAQSPFAKRTMALAAKAAFNIARALTTPAPDLDALAQRLNIPSIPHATLAADSTSWHGSHIQGDSTVAAAAPSS
jgi:NAD(P)H dehydrogenase (quinone)